MFNGGSALNQVPDKTVLGGTTRAMSAELGQLIRKRMYVKHILTHAEYDKLCKRYARGNLK
jgi:mRNA interferase HigB